MAKPRLLWKKTCDTCRRARTWLHGVTPDGSVDEREINAAPLTEAELDALIGTRDHKPFLNTRNELYREHKMGRTPPTRAQALRLIAQHPNLMRRPLLIAGKDIAFGFDEAAWKELLS